MREFHCPALTPSPRALELGVPRPQTLSHPGPLPVRNSSVVLVRLVHSLQPVFCHSRPLPSRARPGPSSPPPAQHGPLPGSPHLLTSQEHPVTSRGPSGVAFTLCPAGVWLGRTPPHISLFTALLP